MKETSKIISNLQQAIVDRKVLSPSQLSEAATLLAILYGEECRLLTELEIRYQVKVSGIEQEYTNLPDIKIKNKSKLTEEYKAFKDQETTCKVIKELIQSIKKHSTNVSTEMTLNNKI
jgi:hypothetical protein